MFYHLSKIIWVITAPSNLLVSLILFGLMLALLQQSRGFGISVALTAAITTAGVGFLPIANYILLPLENRFPAFQDDSREVSGIILLTGFVRVGETRSRGSLAINDASERLLYTIQFAQRHPKARIIITGAAEAPIAADFLKGLGIDPARIIVEDRAQTTYQNAVFSRDLVVPAEGEQWLLITSAWHMPRAIGVFQKAGFPVTPYPVDFRVRGFTRDEQPFAQVSEGLRQLDIGVKEWMGLIGYYATGRTMELFPSSEATRP